VEYIQKVKKQMQKWIEELNNNYILTKFNSIQSGKMVRSQLIFFISQLNNLDSEKLPAEKIIKLSAIIEMIHLASLLHDDVIDDAETRRGVPSINATEGSKISIMLGDILYSKAFMELGKFEQKIIEIVSQAVTNLSIGEIEDVNLATTFNSDENLYLNMIYKKTASLIEASTWASAVLIKHPEADKFRIYGKNLGLAFQIIDDILDITQTSEQLGKPAMNDFVEGKTTLPYIYLYFQLNEKDKNLLKSLHLKKLDKNETNWLMENLNKTNSIQKSLNLAEKYSQTALKSIENLNTPELEKIVYKLMQRDH
jgi:octaprenyl-diphosphate synthase